MQERHYKSVLYFIAAIIAITLAMQIYWNFKNYESGKQQLINEVQIGLDNAVDRYYTNLAKENIIGFTLKSGGDKVDKLQLDSLMIELENASHELNRIVRNGSDIEQTISIFSGAKATGTDTIFKKLTLDKSMSKEAVLWHLKKDSMTRNPLAHLTSKVIIAITEDSLDLAVLDTLITSELSRKKITVDYGIRFTNPDGTEQSLNKKVTNPNSLFTSSKSGYLPKNSKLLFFFTNETLTILQKNLFGIFLSLIFMVAVIACLLYLLRIIRKQKQLAEVKNDLISNITHEFKTPIATIAAAMEGITSFNKENDAEKNLKYARISGQQVEKLNGMVEKLLETATLDSKNLTLNLESLNLVELLRKASWKENFALENKRIIFEASEEIIMYEVDAFHFENAVNNIIDNAIKYGGQDISVSLKNTKEHITISISDTGTSLSEVQAKQIFEKFYRVPKGNTHDIKGFGIGLYYSKKIIEKHRGKLSVSLRPTTFKIHLPL